MANIITYKSVGTGKPNHLLAASMLPRWPYKTQVKTLASVGVGFDALSTRQLSASLLESAASALEIDVELIKAFAKVEGLNNGFILDGADGYVPVILFERHIFHRLTKGKLAGKRVTGLPKASSLLSSSTRGGYGLYSYQHKKLQAAVKLNRDAALKACSWGMFQVLGLNYARAGFTSVQGFVTAMYGSIAFHLEAFVNYCLSDEKLVIALQSKDFYTVAELYNGPGNRIVYGKKIADAYSLELVLSGRAVK